MEIGSVVSVVSVGGVIVRKKHARLLNKYRFIYYVTVKRTSIPLTFNVANNFSSRLKISKMNIENISKTTDMVNHFTNTLPWH